MASLGYVASSSTVQADVKRFGAQLDKFQADSADAVTTIARVLALHTLGQLVQRSPVGNPTLWASKAPAGYVGGRFRGNWQLSIGEPDESEIARTDTDGAATIATEGAKLTDAPPFPEIWITNNLPYSEALESGHSDQAPFGMLALTYAEIVETYATDAQRILEEMELA